MFTIAQFHIKPEFVCRVVLKLGQHQQGDHN
jgi:hypothetical protein